jgi:hypothetical protein
MSKDDYVALAIAALLAVMGALSIYITTTEGVLKIISGGLFSGILEIIDGVICLFVYSVGAVVFLSIRK